MRTVYIETSIVSYLTSRPSRDVRVAAWQEITSQWWQQERGTYRLFTSELTLVEAGGGDADAAGRRLEQLKDIPILAIDDTAKQMAIQLIEKGGIPEESQADALHIAIAAVHGLDYLLTWNCRHINNAAAKPLIRSICAVAGYPFPEICTPLELLSEDQNYVPR
jgi:predicted nucleic acid-binding protein